MAHVKHEGFIGAVPPQPVASVLANPTIASKATDLKDGPNDDATITTPTILTLGGAGYGLIRHFLGDYYYRIWVIPNPLNILNPRVGVLYPFHVWNSYTAPNNLNSINGTGLTGLTLDITPPSLFKAVEYRLVNLTIGPTAPTEINAHYNFVFDNGTGLLDISAVLTIYIDLLPDIPVTEFWDWLTDVIIARDSTEQRISIRPGPKLTMLSEFILETESDRRYRYKEWFKGMSQGVVVPYVQYSTRITQASGPTKLYFDPARSDFRENDFIIILDPWTGLGQIGTVDTVDVDGVTLTSPLGAAVTEGALVAPGYASRLHDATGPAMRSVIGRLEIQATMLGLRNPLSRPGSTAVITYLNSLPILDRRPLAMEDVNENFLGGIEMLDSDVGMETIRTQWPHPFIEGNRRFYVKRVQEPIEMDYWRDFLNLIKGKQNPFLFSTYREDLVPTGNPSVGSPNLTIVDDRYRADYFPNATYKYIRIETTGGTLHRRVLTATDGGNNTTILELDAVFPVGMTTITKVSFLNICRLESDRVKWIHGSFDSVVELTHRTING